MSQKTKDKREEENENIESLYLQDYVVPLLEVLSILQSAANFLPVFEHHVIDHLPKRPADKLFFAAIIGYGCNIGIPMFSYMTKGIRPSSLETTALHDFDPGDTDLSK
ncbi:Tn3 family transposase [Pedobacter nototheniae]|uniref:Tn3 family transposase n=1 Tax=Pedobacter nototheniae TaxID=2488994 RepID=UPI0010402F10|nr:Tn3 family transposase [Pedobacter nototheniae]